MFMELIDTHAHLYSSEFNADRDEVLQAAIEVGISKIVLPAIDSESHDALIEWATMHPDHLFPFIGLHPTSVKADYKKELSIVEQHLAKDTLFYGIGEIGIDLYWDKTYFKEQQDAFVTQANWAKELGLPLIIHTRDSFNETYQLLEPLADGKLTGIFHCFGGTMEQAQQITSIGFKLGIGGVVTFKNSTLPEVLKQVQLHNLVLETDSPYLAPVPFRGKRNQSSYLKIIAEKLAQVFETSIEEVAMVTTQNARQLLSIR